MQRCIGCQPRVPPCFSRLVHPCASCPSPERLPSSISCFSTLSMSALVALVETTLNPCRLSLTAPGRFERAPTTNQPPPATHFVHPCALGPLPASSFSARASISICCYYCPVRAVQNDRTYEAAAYYERLHLPTTSAERLLCPLCLHLHPGCYHLQREPAHTPCPPLAASTG